MSSNKYKILIVEDDNAICSFVKTTLEANGYASLDSSFYWSSTEKDYSRAYTFFDYGNSSVYYDKNDSSSVRAVLAF